MCSRVYHDGRELLHRTSNGFYGVRTEVLGLDDAGGKSLQNSHPAREVIKEVPQRLHHRNRRQKLPQTRSLQALPVLKPENSPVSATLQAGFLLI